MQKLSINGKDLEVKYTFKSIKEWHRQFPKAKDDEDLYDAMATGLIYDNPMVLMKVLYGGLAHLGNHMPTFDGYFDGVSDYMSTLDKPEELYAETLAELTHSGFFGLQLTSLKKRIGGYKESSKKALEKVKADEKLKKEKDYQETVNELQGMKAATENMLKTWDEKLKATENG